MDDVVPCNGSPTFVLLPVLFEALLARIERTSLSWIIWIELHKVADSLCIKSRPHGGQIFGHVLVRVQRSSWTKEGGGSLVGVGANQNCGLGNLILLERYRRELSEELAIQDGCDDEGSKRLEQSLVLDMTKTMESIFVLGAAHSFCDIAVDVLVVT